MADVLALRTNLRADQAVLDAAQARLDQLTAQANDPDLPPLTRAAIRRLILAQARVVATRTAERDAALAAYQAAVQDDPLHAADPALPLVLLPVRIETAYLPRLDGAGVDLAVRVYPDDLHVDAHEPELTPAEQAAATAYWQAVWGAGANTERLDAAWRAAASQVRPARAGWAITAMTPATARPADETPQDQPQPDPPLPAVETRPGAFNRAARTRLLPDHWRVVGLSDGVERFNVEGLPIPDALDVSFGPPGTGANDSDLPFNNDSRWLVDLDLAIAAGMAVRIPLDDPDRPIDQLFVLGASAQLAPADGAARLQAAFLAHQYTNGLGFLPPGAPTNNTAATRSAWQSAPEVPTPADIDKARGLYQPAANQNAALAARALGVDGAPSLSVADFGLDDQQTALLVVQRQLWNAIGAKALSRLYTTWDIPAGGQPSNGTWRLHDNPAATAMLKDHMLGWVRSRGTLPVLRIGNQPYGLLPATSLADWVIAADDPTTTLVTWLRTLRQYFLAAVASAPRIVVGGGQDPDAVVTDVLQRLPVSQDVMVRPDGDPIVQAVSNKPLPAAPIPGLPQNSEMFLSAPDDQARRLLIPVVGDGEADRQLLLDWAAFFHSCIAVLEQTKTTADWVATNQALFGQQTFPGAPPPDLFTTLVQDSLHDPMAPNNDNDIVAFMVFGACGFEQNKNDAAFLRLVQMRLPAARDFVAKFEEMMTLDPASYEPVTRELLDISSYRLDAWITSLAARRLDQMRAARPEGVVIGAYGWVEDLAPRQDLSPAAPPPPGFETAFTSPRQTFVHAPSLQHAATAAVLRAGLEFHAHADTLAVNLESRRVRLGVWLAEGVRNGQTVGALLGYRFERGLHEAGLDGLIEGLRRDHPLPLLDGQDESGPDAREAIAARNVVDGLDLYRKQADVRARLPQVGGLLDALADALDAYGDLLLAESVHHLVGGNPLRAGLAADAVGRGEPPPDRFDVARTPRRGRALTWQVGVLLPAAWRSPTPGWRQDRPRAQVEPHAEAWAASLLGSADLWQIDCTVTTPGEAEATVRIGMEALGLCALDVVCEAGGSTSTLQRRIEDAVLDGRPAGTAATVSSVPAADGALGFAALTGFAGRLAALLAQASPLSPQHVQGADTSPTLGLDTAELAARADGLRTALATATDALAQATQALADVEAGPDAAGAVTAARAALLAMADLGVANAYPAAGAPDDADTFAAIEAQAGAVLAAAQAFVAAPALPPPAPDAADRDRAAWLKAVTESIQDVVGKTVPVAPTFQLPATSAYASAFAADAAPTGAGVAAVTAWLRRLARVRPQTLKLYDTLTASAALTGAAPALRVAQLPAEPGGRWIGLPFDGAPPKARLAVVVSTPTPVNPLDAFCGLLLDNWTEQLPGVTGAAEPADGPSAAEITGVAFTVDAPDAFPPQAILLAVAPDPATGWSLDVLVDVVQETLDLAKIRTVDLGDLPRLGRVLPALHSGTSLDDVIQKANP